jgi:UDPglucose 6-dehydrogenase
VSDKETICVCGLGKVGKPILDTLRWKGFDCIGYDIDDRITEAPIAWAASSTTAAIFIVPTPSLPDGSFSHEFLENALMAFRFRAVDDFLYVVSSTTVPGSCDSLGRRIGIKNLCYRPEFIRLAHVRHDLLNPAYHLIGSSNPEAGDRCEAIYREIADVPAKRMSLIEAELAKITLNCALTMKISLANQLHLVAQKFGADSEKIMDAVGTDPRIGHAYLKPGAPYGGPCLPRDNRMFQYVARLADVNAALSEGADKINEAISHHEAVRPEARREERQQGN